MTTVYALPGIASSDGFNNGLGDLYLLAEEGDILQLGHMAVRSVVVEGVLLQHLSLPQMALMIFRALSLVSLV